MKTQALVLSALSYGDRQLIVDLFSREAGRQSFIVQLAAGRKGKMRKMLFQPLMLLDVDFTQRPTRTLQRFSEVIGDYTKGKDAVTGEIVDVTRPVLMPARGVYILDLSK